MGHGIVPDDASWGTFIWIIAAFITTTIFLALSLQTILARLRRWAREAENAVKPKLNPRRAPDAENMQHSSSTSALALNHLRDALRLRKQNKSRPEDLADVEMANGN